MGEQFAIHWPEFNQQAFVKTAAKNLNALELKERSSQITSAMACFFPDDFEHAGQIMIESLAPVDDTNTNPTKLYASGLEGWAIMPMTNYVGLYGMNHFRLSIILLKEMTKRFSSEFDIRFFLIKEPKRTLSILEKWTSDPSVHVRRLVSEGTRPRLPWAMQLPAFIDNPTPILHLLETLKDDEEEYVRRSVANNLNDIAKDHPDLVAKIAKRWMKGASKNRERLVRHACRTLIKQGHKETLKALGYGQPKVNLSELKILTPNIDFGEAFIFEIDIRSVSKTKQELVIDYAIHHRKSNGGTTPKIFKWKNITLAPNSTLNAKKKHAIKQISTRKYYPGIHMVEIFINGVSFGKKNFELIM
ncbi:MAG: DNA alkylation repair protein [Nitrospinales bacterium]